ncbi:hypothetical protein FHS43_004427 [Streptosporangium becharense]|uniref:Uncharacterized protein n=1 Tax=Streptosporangium becharense TaxID=1816182 RepID=A0A7W9IK10_9ACTN|nr:hypothetical protein [Streptosporangium becharense]MBB2913129.1 hypothetical protein [Streptosporangium becharense]MBB5822112.1 hypothetical protein [Streptosporangium becharense]
MLDGLGGTQGTREKGSAPTRAAEADTPELPQAGVRPRPKPSASPVKRSLIGDLRMRVIYRILAVVTALAVAAVAAVTGFFSSGSSDQPGGDASGPIAAPSAAAPSPGSSSPPVPAPTQPAQPTQSVQPTQSAQSAQVPAASPPQTPSASAPASATPSAPASSGDPGDTGTATPEPDRSAVVAALADPRVPELRRDRRLGRLPGKSYRSKHRIQDRKAGVSLVRLGRPWKIFGAAPFSTRQVLPRAKGAGHRAMLVSCPVPTLVQRAPKDTALLAARWTLNHHPRGSRISWVASQPLKRGWLLAYRVNYRVKGKPRSSMAAVAVTEVPGAKPAMLFVTIPDSQRGHWRDINTAVSSLRLG